MPNNVVEHESEIGLKEDEVNTIKAGKPFPSWKFIPWILDELNLPLQQKPEQEEPKADSVHSS